MDLSNPATTGFTRLRLRQIACWIREDLDPVIARDGPESLRADDVLALHDIFQGLRTSQSITALDLRATGIHRAVLEISGIATRWPGRLCDDCDKIISVWTAKFGRLEDLHPFLYGRGGRLEGITTIEESSKQALVKRWQTLCPDKIAPKKSHRSGDLGFRAGAWWINSLFAWHAGIINFESVEGGTCYNRHGAYALLLKDESEIETTSLARFTYRCGRDEDKGSHSNSSVWSPKAGVRYDGLYRVVSWAVFQKKSQSSNVADSRANDIVYDIRFERDDPVPVEEVVSIPSAHQVDDYTEYKRLRKAHRDRKPGDRASVHTATQDAQCLTRKIAPQIAPAVAPTVQTALTFKASPNASRSSTFNHPAAQPLEKNMSLPLSQEQTVIASAPVPATEPGKLHRDRLQSMLEVPVQAASRSSTQSKLDSPSGGLRSVASNMGEFASSKNSVYTTTSCNVDITEVAPWVNCDLPLSAPASLRTTATEQHGDAQTEKGVETKHKAHPMQSDGRQMTLTHNKNPVAKLLDGALDVANDSIQMECRESPPTLPSVNPRPPFMVEECHDPMIDPSSQIPVGLMSSTSPVLLSRRGAVHGESDIFCPAGVTANETLDEKVALARDPFAADDTARLPTIVQFGQCFPVLYKETISSKVATSPNSSTCSIAAEDASIASQ